MANGLFGIDLLGPIKDVFELLGTTGFLGSGNREYLADREHTELREDTAYQRAVSDMRAAGLNPYTIGSSPANSSQSNVGAQTLAHRLQILGYILDLKNLDAKNRKITNDAIGDVLGFLKQK